jgi:hypothetical protein
VGTPGGLRQFVSKVAVTALASLNVVGDKLIWSKVKARFGWKLKTIISGGSALAGSLEKFYEPAGLHVIVGDGLTESSLFLGRLAIATTIPSRTQSVEACKFTKTITKRFGNDRLHIWYNWSS